MPTSTAKEDKIRITARVPARQRDRLEEAAALSGATLNQFVVQAAVNEAQRILERENTIHLSLEGAKRVLKLMENPPPPNAKLKKAVETHRALIRGA